jgi:hypothetical protein
MDEILQRLKRIQIKTLPNIGRDIEEWRRAFKMEIVAGRWLSLFD